MSAWRTRRRLNVAKGKQGFQRTTPMAAAPPTAATSVSTPVARPQETTPGSGASGGVDDAYAAYTRMRTPSRFAGVKDAIRRVKDRLVPKTEARRKAVAVAGFALLCAASVSAGLAAGAATNGPAEAASGRTTVQNAVVVSKTVGHHPGTSGAVFRGLP